VDIDHVDWSDPVQSDSVRDYFARFITATNPDPFHPRPSHDCLLDDRLLQASRDLWDIKDDHCNLCNRCQHHGTIKDGQRHCVPSQCHRRGSCRFHFPYMVTAEPLAYVDHTDNEARKRFVPSRNDPWLNQHSTSVLLAWRANIDLQPVLDRKAAIRYISKYASKPEAVSTTYHTALNDFCSRVAHDLPAERVVQRLFAQMAADRDISAQEAVHLLLGESLVGCSRSFVNLNADVDAPSILRENLDVDDTDAAFEQSFFARYQARPAEQDNLNATQFCSMFDTVIRTPFSFPFLWPPS
jgi:hypothetical protein